MICYSCYKKNVEGYCLQCRKRLFDGAKVSHVLDFEPPMPGNMGEYQERTKRLSISGVQLKYSLKLDGRRLALTEKGGQYIIKPIPPTTLITETAQAPENEHLTMQIAQQVFQINTAANALIYFRDGTPAYLTRRFDVKAGAGKWLQEDMAQLSGSSRQTRDENFKYEGSYEDIGLLIRRHVAAYPPALENYFRLLVFNYLFSNGDAHLKNFSLLQTAMGDYALSPAYDLMSTVLHTSGEDDVALDLFKADTSSAFYSEYGFYGQSEFRQLADRMGVLPHRASRIFLQLLTQGEAVAEMTDCSFLSPEVKNTYMNNYLDKVKRMGMSKAMIAAIVDIHHNEVYTVTRAPTTLRFRDGGIKVGFFTSIRGSDELEKHNKYSFVENKNRILYQEAVNKNQPDADSYAIVIDGDLLVAVEYAHPTGY